MELRGGKNPDQDRSFFFFLVFSFFLFFFLAKGSHRREGKEENYNPWFGLSYAGKYVFLISPHAKKKKNKKTKNPTWNYAQSLPMLCQLSAFRVSPLPAVGATLGLQAACRERNFVTTSQKPSHPEASSFLSVGYKNRTSVINRRVLNTFNH